MTMLVGTSLYQAGNGATFAPSLPFEDVSAEVQADSWLTLGSADPGGVMLSTAGLGDALANFDAGQSWEVSSAAGGVWFVLPDMEEASFPDSEGRVLWVSSRPTDMCLGR